MRGPRLTIGEGNCSAANAYAFAMKKAFILLVGGTVTLIGVALLVLPGPAFIVIPAGLAILAIEFKWARRWLDWTKAKAKELADKAKAKLGAKRNDA